MLGNKATVFPPIRGNLPQYRSASCELSGSASGRARALPAEDFLRTSCRLLAALSVRARLPSMLDGAARVDEITAVAPEKRAPAGAPAHSGHAPAGGTRQRLGLSLLALGV